MLIGQKFNLNAPLRLILYTITLVALLAFAMSCKEDDGTSTGGETMSVSYPVDNGVGWPDETDFSYWENTGEHLKNYIDGEVSVKTSGGKLNIDLGTPKTEVMKSFDDIVNGVTINPIGVKLFMIEDICFCTSD